MPNSEEFQLIYAYLKSGDKKSLDTLIKLYLKPVYNFILRLVGSQKDAEDLTQETFIKMWRNLKKFNTDKEFKPWVFQIAKNTCFDFFRRKKETSFSELALAEEDFDEGNLADQGQSLGDLFQTKETAEQVNRVLLTLPVIYRTVLVLYFYQQLNFREIAETLNESLNTVKSKHRRGLFKLKEMLKKQG